MSTIHQRHRQTDGTDGRGNLPWQMAIPRSARLHLFESWTRNRGWESASVSLRWQIVPNSWSHWCPVLWRRPWWWSSVLDCSSSHRCHFSKSLGDLSLFPLLSPPLPLPLPLPLGGGDSRVVSVSDYKARGPGFKSRWGQRNLVMELVNIYHVLSCSFVTLYVWLLFLFVLIKLRHCWCNLALVLAYVL